MNFEWSLPTHIVFGPGRFSAVHKHVRGFGKRALVVTSRSFAKGGARAAVLDELLSQLRKTGVETTIFSEVEPNPRAATIDAAATKVRDLKPRYVIALGGGSVMDAAKCLALLAVNEGPIFEYSHRGPGRPMRPFNHALPIVCIPTIAATGSETSLYAVVTDEASRRKTTIFGRALIPKLSLIDPELAYSLDARQTVDGAFDMMTHALEEYFSSREPAPLQDRMTEALVETVVTFLPRALANPRDELARSQLSWCGALALSGVLSGREGGWPVHALGHGLSAIADLGHGSSLRLLLPRVLAFDNAAIPEKIAQFNKRIFNAPGLQDGLKAYMKRIGAWSTLDELVPAGADVHAIIEGVADHALEVSGIWKRGDEPYLENIRPISRQDAIAILNSSRLAD